MTAGDSIERELKLGAWPEFVLPDLAGVIDGITPGTSVERELDAVYFDTGDLDLLRRGATLRFRRGEPPADVWTVKLPSDAATHGLARREITVAGERSTVPQQFADLARGWALGQRIAPVARMRTRRVSLPLCDGDGHTLASLDDDSVTITRGRRVVARFRELEVELIGDAPAELLASVDARLRAAGAEKVPQLPKLSRALGRTASEPWRLEARELGPKPTIAAAAHEQVRALTAEFADAHALLVLDAPGSARRSLELAAQLRAAVYVLTLFLAADPSPSVQTALERLGAELAIVAELDAITDRIEHEPLRSNLGRTAAAALNARVANTRARARATLLQTLRGRQHAAAVRSLVGSSVGAPTTPSPRLQPAAGKLARATWRSMRDSESADGTVLAARLERLRCALRLACSAADDDAATALERVERLAAAANDRNHAAAVAARLQALARRAPPDASWAAGMVAGLELARADVAAASFASAWDDVAAKSTWSWAG